ncbi:hypothetical protein HPB50_006103 [Hyalomma asiaticum]|uniref:Uncharacterized protein n=1 Tax=Hyalomma asiaticum TaxID=266040 RepID=A0ACB7RTG7_HYAAI|nr:hypothetical protein HPB50_006103 [Hyalomma asiaticum]
MDLWPRVDSSDIHEFLVRRTSFITREQLKSRKALEGHNFVTSGWVREPWVKKVAAYTAIVVTQVNHSQSVNKPPVDVCTANDLGANTCSADLVAVRHQPVEPFDPDRPKVQRVRQCSLCGYTTKTH